MSGLWILILVFGLLLVYTIVIFNRLVALRRETLNAWSQIDVQLKRRYDLIPNLVETVKGYMKFEQETLEKVIQARNVAINATTVKEKADAENQLSSALGGIFALSEAYPDLKANQNMLSLQEELKTTENKISFARQYYNDVVTEYNTRTEMFPSSFIAQMGGFKHKDLFELEDAAAREPTKIQF